MYGTDISTTKRNQPTQSGISSLDKLLTPGSAPQEVGPIPATELTQENNKNDESVPIDVAKHKMGQLMLNNQSCHTNGSYVVSKCSFNVLLSCVVIF